MSDIKKIVDTLDEASDGFAKIADKQQKKMYDEILLLVKNLDTTPDGKIKQSIANLKMLTQIKAKLSKLAKDDEWAAGIGKFLQYFSLIQKQQNDYFTSHFAENTLTDQAKKKHELMKQMAVQNTIEGLIGTGLQTNVTDPINNFLLRAVTSGEKFADLQQELHDHLLGVDDGKGAFARYAGTYATTAMTQFTGQNNKLLTDDLGVEWFMYVGSNKETTREFCEQLTKKRYIHKSEIPSILQGRIDDYQCAIYPKTGLPYGMIDGTNEDNFQCNCGGWNCRHQLVPVDEMVVPASIRTRILNANKINNKLKKANDLQKKSNRLYSTIFPISTEIVRRLIEAKKDKERQNILKEVIEDKSFNIKFNVGDFSTKVHPLHKGSSSKNWDNTLEMAKDINKSGADVTFLPESGKEKSADAITKMFGKYAIVEFKYSSSANISTISHALQEGFKQSKNIVLKLQKMSLGEFSAAIDYLIRNNHYVGNIKLINSNGKIKDINADQLTTGKYKKMLRGFL